jgi:hypothetical protein
MAVVRISDSLKNDIVNNARNSFRSQVIAVAHFQCPPEVMTGDRILNAFIGVENLERMNLLPVGYFKEVEKVKIMRIMTSSSSNILLQKDFPLSGKRRVPYDPQSNNIQYISNGYSPTFQATLDPFWDEMRALAIAWHEKKTATAKRQEEFVTSVKTILGQFTTLAPALKAWPALWDLVPEKDKERHRTVVSREKASADLSGVDLNKLTALATQAKMIR